MKSEGPNKEVALRVKALPPSMKTARINKARVAEAAHEAVCSVTGTDGAWHCLHYAHAGFGLLTHLGVRPQIEAGRIDIIDDGIAHRLVYAPDKARERISGHVWLRLGGEIVDLTARHFASYAGTTLRRSFGMYLWGNSKGRARYTPIRGAIRDAGVMATDTLELWAAAINAYEGRMAYLVEHLGLVHGLGYGARLVRAAEFRSRPGERGAAAAPEVCGRGAVADSDERFGHVGLVVHPDGPPEVVRHGGVALALTAPPKRAPGDSLEGAEVVCR